MTNKESMNNMMVQMGAIIESIQDILDGKEVSDFMISFPIVRAVWDLKHSALTGSERPEVDLYKEIMNIQVDEDRMIEAIKGSFYRKAHTWEHLYNVAFRDARHAAAEIAAGRWRKVEP